MRSLRQFKSRAFALTLVSLLQISSSAQAVVIVAPEAQFTAPSGQPLFPADNLNVFKQYVLGFKVHEEVGDTVEIDLLFTTLEFGGEVEAGLNAHFGLEFGLCLGGNADFDLRFAPRVILPDLYPSEIPIPITISEGLLRESHFTTTFPPLGKMYADLILDLGAQLRAEACVFGCFTPINFNFSTCDLPALPSGDKLFNKSTRCDPTLTQVPYCAIELASFNRNDDNKARMLNVTADNVAEFLAKPFLEFAPSFSSDRTFTADPALNFITVVGGHSFFDKELVNISTSGTLPGGLAGSRSYFVKTLSSDGSVGPTFELATRPGGSAVDFTSSGSGTHKISKVEIDLPDDVLSGGYGSLSMAAPTVNTDSAASFLNTPQVLRASGSEDVIGIGIDLARMISDFIIPPPLPPISDSGSIGPVDWDYTLAALKIGPAIQLQMDFEMTWDLAVTNIKFTEVGSDTPKQVRIFTPSGSAFPLNGNTVTELNQAAPARTFLLKNSGPRALPMISLITDLPANGPQSPVEVHITYELVPKLMTVVSLPMIGGLNYEVMSAGASISRVGDLRIGPLLEGAHKFKLGEFEVYRGDPSTIQSQGSGKIDFTLQSSGPPKFDWNTAQWAGSPGNTFQWTGISSQTISNWQAINSSPVLRNSFPGQGGPNAFAMIDRPNISRLSSPIDIEGLKVGPSGSLVLQPSASPPRLKVAGLVENTGNIYVDGNASLLMDGEDAILCGDGRISLTSGGSLRGKWNRDPFAFCNYNTVTGAGQAMYDYVKFDNQTTIHNLGNIRADGRFGNNGSNRVNLRLTLDDRPGETSWELTTLERDVVASGGPYTTRRATINQSFNLAEGGYIFTIFDSGFPGIDSPGGYTLTDGNGSILASGGDFFESKSHTLSVISGSYLKTGASFVYNEGELGAVSDGRLVVDGDDLDNRIGGTILADGGRIDLRPRQAMHAGSLLATNGGTVAIKPLFQISPAIWSAGRSFREDCGGLTASNFGIIEMENFRMQGGCFFIKDGGRLTTSLGHFTGSVIENGSDNDVFAFMEINGPELQTFRRTCFNNFGSLRVSGKAEFIDNMLFANHGNINIPQGGELTIRENFATTPGASAEALVQPGLANATEDILVGGFWSVGGKLVIDGANFTALGADIAPATTGSASVSDLPTNGVAPVPTFNPEDGPTRVLARGDPAYVYLSGSNWQFDAIRGLALNCGSLNLIDGADFQPTSENFTNKFEIYVSPGSVFEPNGPYTQIGSAAVTYLAEDGLLRPQGETYDIRGGRLTSAGRNNVFNTFNGTIKTGTTLHVTSPLIGDGVDDENYEQPSVVIDIATAIETIAAGAEVVIHGANVEFPALYNNLSLNQGTLIVSGDGIDNAPEITMQDDFRERFTNRGQLSVLGYTSELINETYEQVGVASTTRIGAGARLQVQREVLIDGGEIVFEVGSRPNLDQYGTITGRPSVVNFNNLIVIDFVGELAEANGTVDTGDTWDLMASAPGTMEGIDTIEARLDGAPLPAGWLPANSHLELIRFVTPFGPRGLRVRVTPDAGFISYDDWAASAGLDPASYLADPYRESLTGGFTNVTNFIFGAVEAGTQPNEALTHETAADGHRYNQVSFARPFGTDASYTPYYSLDLIHWRRAPMVLTPGTASGAPGVMELVTLRSIYPSTNEQLFYRIQASVNPDNFDLGEIPGKLINYDLWLDNLNGWLENNASPPVSYVVEAGKTLYFNVNVKLNEESEQNIWGGTGPDGERNFIYSDRTELKLAVRHANLFGGSGQGRIKVTFIPTQQTPFIGSVQNEGTPYETKSKDLAVMDVPYSYHIELVKKF